LAFLFQVTRSSLLFFYLYLCCSPLYPGYRAKKKK
jgi:hypothetical protein